MKEGVGEHDMHYGTKFYKHKLLGFLGPQYISCTLTLKIEGHSRKSECKNRPRR